MKRGRPPKGSALVEKFMASEEAKERLKTIVATLTGELTVEEACGHLGVGETRFHQMRDEVLQSGLAAVEPRTAGRPPKEVTAEEQRVAALQARIEQLEMELEGAHLRAKLALVMPHVLRDLPDKKK